MKAHLGAKYGWKNYLFRLFHPTWENINVAIFIFLPHLSSQQENFRQFLTKTFVILNEVRVINIFYPESFISRIQSKIK
jgi:hypothetical protein